VAHVNILKQVKSGERWRLVAIPRKKNGDYDWNALPEGRYFIEWYERGRRKRGAGGGTAAEVQEAARRRKHILEGRALGIEGSEEEETKRTAIHIAAKRYLDSVQALKKPNTFRKYKAVLDRFVEFLPPNADPRKVTRDDLTDFMVRLKNKHKLDNNTVIHQMIIVAQFLKRCGKPGVTKGLGLPERIVTLPLEARQRMNTVREFTLPGKPAPTFGYISAGMKNFMAMACMRSSARKALIASITPCRPSTIGAWKMRYDSGTQ
jgi:hypothetical protein